MLYLYFWNMDECGYPLQTASSLIISVAFYCWTPGTDKRPEGVPAEAGNFRLSFSEVVHMAGSDSAYTIMNLFHNFDQAAYHCHYLILYIYILFWSVDIQHWHAQTASSPWRFATCSRNGQQTWRCSSRSRYISTLQFNTVCL